MKKVEKAFLKLKLFDKWVNQKAFHYNIVNLQLNKVKQKLFGSKVVDLALTLHLYLF